MSSERTQHFGIYDKEKKYTPAKVEAVVSMGDSIDLQISAQVDANGRIVRAILSGTDTVLIEEHQMTMASYDLLWSMTKKPDSNELWSFSKKPKPDYVTIDERKLRIVQAIHNAFKDAQVPEESQSPLKEVTDRQELAAGAAA